MAPGMDALDRRDRIAKAARIGVPLIVVLVLGVGVWKLASNTAGERREVPQVPVVALTPPPPPPPPPPPKEKPPEPEKTVETPTPTPTPQPKTDTPQKSDAPKQLTINGPAQAGTDAFGVAAGKGGGVSVGGDPNGSDTPGGGDFGADGYGRYLRGVVQQAIEGDERVNRLSFTGQVDIWISPDGRITKIALIKSSGDVHTDHALIAALQDIRRVDEPPPPQLKFPARVALRGRRT
ncbi:MAG: TonB C-terminal domain-containing protein [Caulobacteraceae bacterium]